MGLIEGLREVQPEDLRLFGGLWFDGGIRSLQRDVVGHIRVSR